MKKLLIGFFIILLLFFGLLLQRRLAMPEPTGLGATNGRLSACPERPNCVSSFAEGEEHRIEPLTLVGTPAEAMAKIKQALEAMPRIVIVDASDHYLHAEATSLIYRYVDDLEVLIDADNGKIHLRSASRTGYSDLGVNRNRVQALADAYTGSGR